MLRAAIEPMAETATIDGLRAALGPVDVLRGDQSELETSIRESFAALEAFHDELSEWQRELTRQQAELDQREAEATEAERARRDDDQRHLQDELGAMRQLLEQHTEMLISLGAEAEALAGPAETESPIEDGGSRRRQPPGPGARRAK